MKTKLILATAAAAAALTTAQPALPASAWDCSLPENNGVAECPYVSTTTTTAPATTTTQPVFPTFPHPTTTTTAPRSSTTVASSTTTVASSTTRPSASSTTVTALGPPVTASATPSLPVTGTSPVPPLIGGSAVVIGAVLALVRRKARA